MTDAVKKGLGYILTGGLSLAAGVTLVATGTVAPWVGIVSTIVVVLANVFGIFVSKPQ